MNDTRAKLLSTIKAGQLSVVVITEALNTMNSSCLKNFERDYFVRKLAKVQVELLTNFVMRVTVSL